MKLIVLGMPGVGKGTYTKGIVDKYDLVHISTGDIFRENIKNKTSLGQKVEAYLSNGELVPDNLVIDLIEDRLGQEDCQNGFVLDGFPRTLEQAQALTEIISIDLVLNFKADFDVIIDRLSGRRVCQKCGAVYHVKNIIPKKEGHCDLCDSYLFQRPDDNPETIKERLNIYEEKTAPLINYYVQKNILRELTFNQEFGKFADVIMTEIYHVIDESLNKTKNN